MTTPVSFTIAKLLKEKGFNESTTANYYILAKDHSENYKKGLPVDESKIFLTLDSFDLERKIQIDEEHEHNVYHVMNCPTISQAVMWLYEKHGIWINVNTLFDHEVYGKKDKWEYGITNLYNAAHYDTDLDFNSPTKAYEVAIKYCLKKII